MADDGGIGRLQRRLAAIPKEVKAAALPAVVKQAEQMATTMRSLVPVDTGDLKSSIAVTPAGQSTPAYSQPGGSMTVPENAAAITVGNEDVRYAHLVEYGTRGAPAKAYFWPAVRFGAVRSRKAIKSAIGRAVRNNWGKGS